MKDPSPVPNKVLIVDPSATVRQALRWALEGLADFAIVGEASRGEDALALIETLHPDIVLLETDLAGLDGYAVARSLKSRSKSPRILFLTHHSDPETQRNCTEAGSDAFLPKSAGWQNLIVLMGSLLDGHTGATDSPSPDDATANPDGDGSLRRNKHTGQPESAPDQDAP